MTASEGTAELIAAARTWMLDDPDPVTRAELETLVERARAAGADAEEARAELEARFDGRLAFGTAGLRARVGAGPTRMNRKVVAQTSAGFAAFLLKRAVSGETTQPPSVVVGFDARVNSQYFALEAASVLAGAGLSVTLFDHATPTPILAFAVRHLDASAGVMITASHNPPEDNGYKVYLGDADAGSQIAPPVDAEIAALIDVAAAHPLSELPRSQEFLPVPAYLVDSYIEETVHSLGEASSFPGTLFSESVYTNHENHLVKRSDTASLRIVYTAMHGVGHDLTKRVFLEAGLPEFVSVPEQEQPDGRFPTVTFPNPEEPGALDRAVALAERQNADLIVAHDPDADRLAIALPAREGTGFTQLTGNELGLLLGWECAERASALRSGEPGTLAATVVSSPALGAVAREYGLDFVQTLSGFKWVSRVPNLVFGFEEALGYLVNPEAVRDKDGISAAAMAVTIAVRLRAQGRSLWDRLDEASMRFGHFASDQITIRMGEHAAVERLSARIRQQPPMSFEETRVDRFTDFSSAEHQFGGMPVAANVLCFDLEDRSRVMIRPSGTEPKLKLYLDVTCAEGTLIERKNVASERLTQLRHAVEALTAELW